MKERLGAERAVQLRTGNRLADDGCRSVRCLGKSGCGLAIATCTRTYIKASFVRPSSIRGCAASVDPPPPLSSDGLAARLASATCLFVRSSHRRPCARTPGGCTEAEGRKRRWGLLRRLLLRSDRGMKESAPTERSDVTFIENASQPRKANGLSLLIYVRESTKYVPAIEWPQRLLGCTARRTA